MNINLLQLLTGVFVGLASGYIGSFMVLRRMALVGDALTHLALPGLALALLLAINPFIGAFATLFLGIVGIWLIENKTSLNTESLVGLFFTVALAIGILITPREDLLEALFGDISKISRLDTILSIVLSILVIAAMESVSKKFILSTLSPDLAKSTGIKVEKINFIFLFLVAVVVAIGIKSVGSLLMGALVVIPAIASKNITTAMGKYVFFSSIFGLISLVGGIMISNYLHLSPGPIVVLTSASIFVISLLLKKE